LAADASRQGIRAPDASARTFGQTDFQYIRFAIADTRWIVYAVEPRSAGFDGWNISARRGLKKGVDRDQPEYWPRVAYYSDESKVSWWRWPSNRSSLRDFEPKWSDMMTLWWIKRYLLLRIMGKPAGEGLRDSFVDPKLVGREDIAGVECWKLVETHRSKNGGPVRLTVWIAPDAGFAPLAWEDFAVHKGQRQQGYLRTIRALAVSQVAENLWLPTTVVHHEYLYEPDQANAWGFSRLVVYRDLRANEDIDWLGFASWPPLGSLVQDQRAESQAAGDIYYRAGMVSPLETKPQVPPHDDQAAQPLTGHEFDDLL